MSQGLELAKKDNGTGQHNARLFWLPLGFGLLILSFFLPAPAGMKPEAFRALAVMATTVMWWISEALPIPVTSFLVLPVLHFMKVLPFNVAMKEAFGDPIMAFVVGVLALSVAFSRSGLSKRLTYLLLLRSGTRVSMVVGVYFFVSFVISMFITDVAVVAMMIPIVLGILETTKAEPGKSNIGKALMMAIMFGSTLGGITTPAGVTSNVVTMSFIAKNAKIGVSFLEWTKIATPIFLVAGLVAWWLILKMFPPETDRLPFGRDLIGGELARMGRWTTPEISTMVVFLAAVALWLTGELTKIPIAVVSLLILAGISLPQVGAIRKWGELEKGMEWGGLFIIVGGFALGVAATQTGLASWVAKTALAPLAVIPPVLQPMAITLLVAFDSLAFSSFTAAAAVNVPFIIAYAQQNGLPVLTLAMTAGFAASTHFILVTESPSFVLPYAYGYFSFKDFAKIGVILTLLSAVLIGAGMVIAGMPAGVPLPK